MRIETYKEKASPPSHTGNESYFLEIVSWAGFNEFDRKRILRLICVKYNKASVYFARLPSALVKEISLMDKTAATQGVYYRHEDYAGFFCRIIIAIIDAGVLLGGLTLLMYVWWQVWPDKASYLHAYYVGPWILVAYLYLVILQRSVGTLGCFVTGVRIVDMFGNRPSVIRMTGRFIWLLCMLIRFYIIYDIIWLTGEESRQTLRDKIVGTYVIRKKAKPIGTGKYGIKVLCLAGQLWLRLREIEKQSEESNSNVEQSQQIIREVQAVPQFITIHEL